MIKSHKSGSCPFIEFCQVVNLTDGRVCIYDTVGNIAICQPGCHSDLLDKIDDDVMVIVSDESDIKLHGIPEENAVVVDNVGKGRLGIDIARLIRPTDGAIVGFTAPPRRLDAKEIYNV